MKTEMLKNAAEAAAILATGALVALPTETVYGLAANGLDSGAVERIYAVKGRPAEKALSLLVPGPAALDVYGAEVPGAARALAARYWPGPLTIVVQAAAGIPDIVRAGGSTVGLRCPDHPLTRQVLETLGLPLAAPSANPSGAPSPKTAAEVLAYFDGAIDAVLDGGRCGLGVESTIVDLSRTPYRVLRQGAVPEDAVWGALGEQVTLLGITGGSGCGKTTALKVLEGFGALVLDCDEIYHELTGSSAAMREELVRRFGDVYDGTALDRKKLGRIVFGDGAALAALNAITHKYVCREIDRRIADFARQGGTLAAIDAIELLSIEHGKRTMCNIAVTAPAEARVARLMAREGISEDYARARIAAQHTDEYFAENCDYVLRNDGSKAAFEDTCRKFFTEVLEHGKERQ